MSKTKRPETRALAEDLNELTARAFGWTREPNPNYWWYKGTPMYQVVGGYHSGEPEWNPLHDFKYSKNLIDEVKEQFVGLFSGKEGAWILHVRLSNGTIYVVSAKELNEAICRGFLRVMKDRNERRKKSRKRSASR